MSLLSSFIPGRFRLRSPLLTRETTARIIIEALRSCPAVKSLDHNASTGGLLIHYDPLKLPLSRALEAKPLFERLQALERVPQEQALDAQVKDLCDRLSALLN